MARRSTQPELPDWQTRSPGPRGGRWDLARAWLDAYVEAWRAYDEEAIRDLWSEDAVWYRPFGVRARGREEIVAEWMAEKHLFQEGGYDARYEPVAIDNGYVVAHGRTHFFHPDTRVTRGLFDNLWLLRLDPDGRCSEFHEWYSLRED